MTTPAKAVFSEELIKVSRKMRNLFDARVRAEGLPLPRARALIFLGRKGCMTQTELAEMLEIEGPTLVPLLDSLEKQGLIRRQPVDENVVLDAPALVAQHGIVRLRRGERRHVVGRHSL